MREITFFKILLLIFLTFYVQNIYSQETSYREGELIVQLKENVDVFDLTSENNSINLEVVKVLVKHLNIWLLSFDTELITSEAALSNIRESSLVKLAQFNHFIKLRGNFPDDPRFEDQWALHNTGQTGGKPDADIDAPEAWNITTGGTTSLGDEIVIAIIDNGFDLEHEDLDFWKNMNEIPNNGIDDDNNGYIDDYDGWNAYESNGDIPSDFGDTHGTAVTGVAGAKGDNGEGISGVNWNIKIMPIAGATLLENVAVEAYGYALKMRLDYNNTGGLKGAFVVVTNSSFGVEEQFPFNYPLWCAMYDEMGAEGILSSAAGPNNNKNVDEVGDIPCSCSSEYLITVANTDHNDQKYPTSGYGPTTIDLGAPGSSIISTAPNNLYHYQNPGTSFSSPHVAGTVALMFAAGDANLISNYKNDPATVALQFKQWLLRGIDPISSLQGITLTGGRLNSLKALAEIEPGIPFYFINRIQNTEDFGSLIIDNELNSPIQSGDYRSLEESTNHVVRTDELPFLPNWMGGGTTEKHHRWYQANSDFNLNHSFLVDLSTPAQQKAYFRSTECATIQTQLLSGGVGGEVEIRDPWRYYQDTNGNWLQSNIYIPFASPLLIENNDESTYGGVFLDQVVTPGRPNYYIQVREIQPILLHEKYIDWYFQGWNTSGAIITDPNNLVNGYYQTPVVFEQNNAVISAKYKGHLASGSDLATAYNNGRQIAIENGFPDDKWHMVYEDDGQIYYTYSTDNGDTWDDEYRLSSSNSIDNSRPSIFVFQPDVGPIESGSPETSPVLLGVVWDRDAGHLDNRAVFRFMRRDLSWSGEIIEKVFQYNCHPVLSGRIENDEKVFYVLCRHQIFGNIGLSLFRISESQQAFSRVQTTLQEYTSFSSINPSITVDRNLGSVDILHFCWEDENQIIYTNYFGGDIAEPQEISGPSWEGYNHHPSITLDAQDRINVVWDQQGRTYPGTSFNHRYSNYGYEWGPIQRVSSSYKFYTHPSVGAFENSSGGELSANCIYGGLYDEETFIKFLNYNGDGWQFQEETYPGTSAGISHFGSELMSVWTDHSMGLPYLIEDYLLQSSERSAEGGEEQLQDRHYRTLLLDFADLPSLDMKGQVSLSLGEIELVSSLGNQTFLFPHITDTTLLFTQTPSIMVGKENVELRFRYRLWLRNFKKPVKCPQQPLMRIHLLEENKSTPLAVIGELLLNNITSDSLDIEEQISVDLKPFQGKRVNLRLQIIPNYFSVLSKQITRVDVKEFSSGGIENQKTEQLATSKVTLVPDKFALNQNFPNPYNPETTISFDLPKECTATLQIFNTLGEHVTTLVSKRLPAGTHQYNWNSGSLASGVYIYRLEAERFVQTRKMILMK